MNQYLIKVSSIILGLFLMSYATSYSQGDALHSRLISTVPVSENSSDIWGFEKEGIHYAIMGTLTKTNIFSLEDPSQPQLIYEAAGTRSIWRDIKYYGDYIYVTADQGRDGILIIDMSKAPEIISHSFYNPEIIIDTIPRTLQKCHNIYIDENGFAYLAGCNIGKGGVLIFDLNENPVEPVYKGAANLHYSHDAFTRGDTLYTSEIYQGNLGIYDVSDKSNPQLLALQQTSRLFTHNAWPSDDGKYVFTTDERAGAYLDAFDITDLKNIKFLDRFRPLEREMDGVIPHNTHYHKGFLVTSWYTDGLRIIDAHKPDNLVEVAYFDTWEDPLECHKSFSGCWGAFPYTGSDFVYVSDINNGLFVIEVDYLRAAYLEGKVTDINGTAINNVKVEILSDQINRKFSNASGEYKTGLAHDGVHTVRWTHPQYETKELEIDLVRGEVLIGDVQLISKVLYNIGVSIKDKDNQILGVPIKITEGEESKNFVTTADQSTQLEVLSGNYEIQIGQWGYENVTLEDFVIDGSTENKIDQIISEAYEDNFENDLGWTIDNFDTNKGLWTRVIPREINTLGSPSRPGNDADDSGKYAYVTGNGAPGAACDGLEFGETILISPSMNLLNYNFPRLNFDIWYHKGNNPNSPDELEVSIDNGNDNVVLAKFSQNTNEWLPVRDIDISSFIELTDNMRLRVKAQSYDSEYPVTAGFDNFFISDVASSIENSISESHILIFPNPTHDRIGIKKLNNDANNETIKIFDSFGNRFYEGTITEPLQSINIAHWPVGLYFVQVGLNVPQKLIKY